MSAQLPPNPILTTYQYWNWLNVDEATRRQRALDNTYMMFPTVQNNPVSFSKLFLITDAALTKMANTAYVIANLVSYLNSLPPLITSTTWLALQNFTGIETNTVNPISSSGTLTIGSGVDHDIRLASQNSRSVVLHLGDGDNATSSAGIHINNGSGCLGNVEILHGTGSTGTLTLGSRRTSPIATTVTTLNCPLTPMYNPITIPVGAIGYRAPITALTLGPLADGAGTNIRSCVVTQGVWLMYFYVNFSGISFFSFNTTVSINPNFGRRGTVSTGALGSTGNFLAYTVGGTNYYATTTTVFFNVRNGSGGTLNADRNPTSNCVAYRIA